MNQYIAPRIKLNAHLDRIHAIRSGERPAPVNVEIFLTNRCSHGCSWCAYAHTHTRGPLAGKVARPAGALGSGDVMDFALCYHIAKQLAARGVESITWSGGGEPTLHPRFNDIVRAVAIATRLEQGLYTHGGHIDEERAAILKRIMTFVYISLDECDAESFKASKGVNRFDAVLEGVRRLVAAEGKATVGLGFLLHRDNFHRVPDMVKLGRSLGVDYVQFRPIVQYNQDAPDELAEDTAWLSWAIGHLSAYQGDSFVQADIDRFRMYQTWQGHGYTTCYWSALQTAISPSGQVWRCTNKTEYPDALLGDLNTESFTDIWARSGPCQVDAKCRLLCRGHIANTQLQPMMTEMPHANFI